MHRYSVITTSILNGYVNRDRILTLLLTRSRQNLYNEICQNIWNNIKINILEFKHQIYIECLKSESVLKV